MRRDFKKLAFCVLVALVFSFIPNGFTRAQNGSLYLSPSSGNVSVGQTFSVALRVNTGGVAINAAEGAIVFDQSKLSVVAVSKSGSVFTIWAEEPKFSNAEGEINFAGGVPNPGYSGSNGLVLIISFQAKSATTVDKGTDITLVSGGILANDGYGTNILSSLGKASYVISPSVVGPTPTPRESSVTVTGLQKINITSPTHSDSSKWYSNNNPLFKWDLPSGITEVSLVLSKRANSPPIINYIPPISEKLLTELDDGEWYLNGRFRTSAGSGPITSFKFNIDTLPPSDFSVVRLDTDDPTNPRPELSFESSDELSGIDHYELTVNSGEAENISVSEAGRTYAMPLQTPGKKDVEIAAFDKAGNRTSARLAIQIESIDVPRLDKVLEKVREGEGLIVEGIAKPNRKVLIYAVREGKNNTYETVADESGKFRLVITDLSIGKYIIYAKAQDERGAVSNPSNDLPTEVRKGLWDFIFKVFNWFDRLVDVLSRGGLFIAFIAALVGLILVLIELIKLRAGGWLGKIKDWITVKVSRKKSARKLAHIIKDMQDEIKLLNKIAKVRALSTEEKYLKNKISSYIKMLKYIDKEID